MDFSHRLKRAFIPRSVALVGASDRVGSRGTLIWNGVMNSHRILQAYPVNPKYKYIGLTPCWTELSELPEKVDLVVIATPTAKVSGVLRQCAALGIQNVLITPGDETLTADRLWRKKIADFCSSHGINLIGPESSGIIRPQIGLNVSYWPELPRIGHIGLICQSSSVVSAVLDHSKRCSFGFSSILTAGCESCITSAQMLDFLARDPDTHVIAVHVETLVHPRAFYSALRAASRVKPVIILKAGRGENSARLIASRFACPACDDAAFDAMLERTGSVRCDRLEDFCSCLELFCAGKDPLRGRLAVATNGLGFAALCADVVEKAGVQSSLISEKTIQDVRVLTKRDFSVSNPMNLGFEADSSLLARTTQLLLADEAVDSVLLAVSPTAAVTLNDLAAHLAPILKDSFKPVFMAWTGSTLTETENAAFSRICVPVLSSVDGAVKAFAHLCEHKRLKGLTLRPPSAGSEAARHDFGAARDVIDEARQKNRNRLSPEQCERLLRLIGIPCAPGMLVTTPADAEAVARSFNSPVALKICAEGLEQRTRIGGVILNSTNTAADFDRLKRLCAQYAPLTSFTGILVQKMSGRPDARELKLAVKRDPVLGPVISLAAGGKTGELFPKEQKALPPLTEPQARDMVERCVMYSALEPFRGQPEIDMQSLVNAILNLSRLVCEIPAVTELEINPLIADENGVLALDATAGFSPGALCADASFSHMLIAPPPHYGTAITGRGISLRVRSLRADDFEPLKDFIARSSDTSVLMRLQKHRRDLTDEDYLAFTQLDYDRERAYALVDSELVDSKIHGVGRFVIDPGTGTAEFGLLVEDALQHRGFGIGLMYILLEQAKALGVRVLIGYVLTENEPMRHLLKKLNFIEHRLEGNADIVLCSKKL